MLFSRRGHAEVREFTAWYAFFAMCSIIYVSKGGTMDYIVTIGEPFAAIFGGYFLFHFCRKHLRNFWRGSSWHDLSIAGGACAAVMLAVALLGPGISYSWLTVRQLTYELDEYQTMKIVEMIQKNTKPDSLILAPPHYAFIAQRRIAEDYSELFLWSLKYQNERQDKQRERGVQTVERIEALLKAKKIAFIALDLNQTARIPEIRTAIDANYTPLRDTEFKTLNTRLQFYIPKM